jgi:hypothetical protein
MDSLSSTIGLRDITDVEGVLPEDMLAGLMVQGVFGSDAASFANQNPTEDSNQSTDYIQVQNISKVFAPKPEDSKAIQKRQEKIMRLREIRAEKLIKDH